MAQRDVLIIEHDPELRDLLRRIFETAGYACRLAADGREGMEAFRAGRPPLVLTDLTMPGVTGIDLLRQARAVDSDVAVIALSGAADMRTAIESLKLGVYTFLMKPINADELLITAARALERRWLLIERRQYLQAYGQLQETDRTTSARAGLAERDVLILVVEEDAGVRHVFHEIFLGAGYRCILAGDGEEVLVDLGMPMVRGGMRVRDAGIRLLLEIRQEDPDAAVIVASGWAAAEPAIESLKLGADAFLMKPVDVDELLITATRALERRWLLIERRRYPSR
jgi:DNA-binding NtrC family response regulator